MSSLLLPQFYFSIAKKPLNFNKSIFAFFTVPFWVSTIPICLNRFDTIEEYLIYRTIPKVASITRLVTI